MVALITLIGELPAAAAALLPTQAEHAHCLGREYTPGPCANRKNIIDFGFGPDADFWLRNVLSTIVLEYHNSLSVEGRAILIPTVSRAWVYKTPLGGTHKRDPGLPLRPPCQHPHTWHAYRRLVDGRGTPNERAYATQVHAQSEQYLDRRYRDRSVLGSWVKPRWSAVRNKERWERRVRLPKILVLTRPPNLLRRRLVG